MIKHLFKLIWNKKKQNFLMITELLVSFLVLFAIFSLLVYYNRNYRQPIGIAYNNVLTVSYKIPEGMKDHDSIVDFNQALKQMIRSMPEVEEMSFVESNTPFSMSTHNSDVEVPGDHSKDHTTSDVFTVDDNYLKVLGISMVAGRWFSAEDAALNQKAVVISQGLAKVLFGHGPALGRELGGGGLGSDKIKMKVVGVCADVKFKGDLQEARNSLFVRLDSSRLDWVGAILVKVKPDAGAAFEGRLYKGVSNMIRNSSIEIDHLDLMKKNINDLTLVPTIILLVVSAFLIINVALGIFGVLWYNISKRKGEIGLRRAVGASGHSISYQLVAEAVVLCTLSLIVGCFFAVQFPLLNVFDLPAMVYITGMIMAIVFIYGLVIICALYPGKQAAGIYPAVALHEE